MMMPPPCTPAGRQGDPALLRARCGQPAPQLAAARPQGHADTHRPVQFTPHAARLPQ